MKVLVIIDMQNDFISGALGNPDTLAVLPEVCEKVRLSLESECEIMYTMDTHGDDYMRTQEGKKLPVPHCVKGTDGWELPEKLKSIMKDVSPEKMVEKSTFGAKNLPEKILGVCGAIPEKIELAGVCTDICVISNALLLKAFFPETLIIVDSKCCAGTSPEAHNRAIEAMKMCQISIV